MGNHLTQDSIQRLNWLKLVIIGFTFLWIVACAGNIASMYLPGDYSIIDFIIEFIFLLFINVLLFLGIRQPRGVSELPPENVTTDAPASEKNKYAASSLSSTDKDLILKKLNTLREETAFYKKPNLTLRRLSEELNVQTKHLSQVINEYYGKNFCEYINTLRIDDAIEQLASSENDHKTILEIIYDTGFNSKSVFNTIFKKQTGSTPSFYRSKHRKSNACELSSVSSSGNS